MAMLPNFLFVGAMKCGTTSLASQIAEHPEIFVSKPKEPHFFSWNYERGMAWYERHFADAGTARAIGEASTTYTMDPIIPNVPPRIAGALPDTRFIYMIRHPIERIVSHYLHRWYEKIITCPIEQAVETEPELLAYSQYDHQIERFAPHFPLDRWLVLVTEEFAADPRGTHRKVFEFLGVDPTFQPADLAPKNVTADKVRPSLPIRMIYATPGLLPLLRVFFPARLRQRAAKAGGERADNVEISDALYNRLLEILRPNIARLSEMLGRDFFSVWNLKPR